MFSLLQYTNNSWFITRVPLQGRRGFHEICILRWAGGGWCWFSQQIQFHHLHCARSALNTGLIFCLPQLWAHILFIPGEGKGRTVQFLAINTASEKYTSSIYFWTRLSVSSSYFICVTYIHNIIIIILETWEMTTSNNELLRQIIILICTSFLFHFLLQKQPRYPPPLSLV